jgi:hypothetical protein
LEKTLPAAARFLVKREASAFEMGRVLPEPRRIGASCGLTFAHKLSDRENMLPPVAKIHLKPSIRHNFYGFNNDS